MDRYFQCIINRKRTRLQSVAVGHDMTETIMAISPGREAGIPDNYRWYDLDAYKTDFNIYSKYQRRLSDKLEAFGDFQYRSVLYNIGGFRDNPSLKIRNTYHFFNPKVGITYIANNYQLYASYSIGNKEPNRDDFEAGQHTTAKVGTVA